jgi:hypothetical protein
MPCITLDQDQLDGFRASLPCHDLDAVLSITVGLDADCNVYDLNVTIEGEDGEPVRDSDHDRAGIAEIVAAVQFIVAAGLHIVDDDAPIVRTDNPNGDH